MELFFKIKILFFIFYHYFFIILRPQFLKHNLFRYVKWINIAPPFLSFKRGRVTIDLIAIALILSFSWLSDNPYMYLLFKEHQINSLKSLCFSYQSFFKKTDLKFLYSVKKTTMFSYIKVHVHAFVKNGVMRHIIFC